MRARDAALWTALLATGCSARSAPPPPTPTTATSATTTTPPPSKPPPPRAPDTAATATAATPPRATAEPPPPATAPPSPPKTDPKPPATTTPSGNAWARIEVSNPCEAKTEYCVEQVGSTSHTWLGARTSTTHNLNPGDRIRVKKSGSCGDLVYTVAKAGEVGKVEICKRK